MFPEALGAPEKVLAVEVGTPEGGKAAFLEGGQGTQEAVGATGTHWEA